MAKTATSGFEGFDLDYLVKGRDHVVMNKKNQISIAKQTALNMYEMGYTKPIKRTDIKVLGKQAPIPNQIANAVPNKNTAIANGRRNGFWNLLTFSINGTVNKPAGTAAIASTPSNLFGKTRNKLNVGKKYHSGKISKGVANGSAFSPSAEGSRTPKPIRIAKVPNITTGKIYNKSFGQAGSP
jgi:hypothetical protein